MANGSDPVISVTPVVAATIKVIKDSQSVDLDDFTKKYKELKAMAREGEKKGEVAKHRKPQIKRSVGVMYDIQFGLEDMSDNLEKITKALSSNEVIITDTVIKVIKEKESSVIDTIDKK